MALAFFYSFNCPYRFDFLRRSMRAVSADFEKRSEVPIRGRRATQDVYVLPPPADRITPAVARRWLHRGT